MSFFGGNPFASPVGQRIEQATDGSLASENWALNMEICDIINETEDGPKDAIKAIRKRLTQNAGKNYTVVMYTLTVLETCVKNCGKRFHVLACNKEFVQELVKLIGPKNDPPTAVQEKVLSLIQCWADAFRHQVELAGVVQVYSDLKQKGIEFPMTDLDTMAPIHTPQRVSQVRVPTLCPVCSSCWCKTYYTSYKGTTKLVEVGTWLQSIPDMERGGEVAVETAQVASQVVPVPLAPQQATPPVLGPTGLTADQIGKLQSELDVVQGNMAVLGEMLSELTPGREHPSDLELLQELHATCQAMQQRLVELIGKLANDEVTAELLRINDEMNNLFLRYTRFENNRDASRQQKVARDPAQDAAESLIDLSDESAAASPATTALNAKLAGLSVSGATVASQLSAISSVPAQQGPQREEKDDSEFDMFAQSRNISYETSKTGGSTYKDNLEPDQLNGSLAAVTQNRSQPIDELIRMHSESDFDEMAAWLSEHPAGAGGGAPEESLTSSEFERFLAERAAAAEALPSVGQQPPATTASPVRLPHHRSLNKEPESESSLFAL